MANHGTASVQFHIREKRPASPLGPYERYLRPLPAWLTAAGILGCFVKTFALPCRLWLLAGLMLATLFVFEQLRHRPGQLFLAFCGILVSSLLVWAACAKYTRAGIMLLSNAVTRLSSIHTLTILPQYEMTVAEGQYALCVTLFLLPPALLLVSLCGLAAARRSLAFPLTAAALLLCLMVTFRSYAGALWLLPVFLSVCFLLSRRGMSPAAGLFLLLPTAALLLGALLLWALSGGTGGIGGYFSAAKTNWEHRLHTASYESSTQAMPEGRLGEAVRFAPTSETALTVSLAKPCSMYLRGFTAADLTPDGWSALSGETYYDSRALFYRLHGDEFYPERQHNLLSFALDYAEESRLTDMTVEVDSACRAYVYTPYEFYDAAEAVFPADLLGDGGGKATGEGSYHYRYQPRLTIKYPLLATRLAEYTAAGVQTELLSRYTSDEERYRAFVYTHCLTLDDDLQKALEETLAQGAEIGESHLAYADAKAIVLSFLDDHMTYSTAPQNAFDGTGASLEGIIRGKGDGYSTHYASLAAVLLRYYGIPTRYVEGYLVTSADAETMQEGEPYAIPMTQAHAWVEYYHDGVGWVPFEVTPGYADLMDETKSTEKSDAVQNPTEAPENSHAADSKPPEEKVELSPAVWVLLLLVLLLALWFTGRIFILRYYEKEQHNPDTNEAVKTTVRHLLRLLEAEGFAPAGRSAYTVLPSLAERDAEAAEQVRRALDLCGKAAFSGQALSEDESEEARQILVDRIRRCEETEPQGKRLLLRYGMWLY